MSYLVDAYSGDISAEEWAARRKAYEDYLDTIRTRLPEDVYAFAKGPESLHDAWLRSMTIEEESSPDEIQDRWINMHMIMWSTPDVEITYSKVRSYRMQKRFFADDEFHSNLANQAHNDWLVDEISLSEDGFIVHDILFWVAHWVIECAIMGVRRLPS